MAKTGKTKHSSKESLIKSLEKQRDKLNDKIADLLRPPQIGFRYGTKSK